MLKIFYIGILTLALAACSKGYGNKLEGENLNIYFEFKEDEKLANELGRFWKKNDLLGSRKQNIRLTKNDEAYLVMLIATENDFQPQGMGFADHKLLFDLQSQLNKIVFKETINCEIVICDGTFNPLYNINQ